MPTRMSFLGPWPILKPKPRPVTRIELVPADPRDEELRALRAEVIRLRSVIVSGPKACRAEIENIHNPATQGARHVGT